MALSESVATSTPRPTADGALMLCDIRMSFGGAEALCGVSLTIRPGEILAVVGENGAGKSTLMKIAAGVHTAGSFRGSMVVGGRHVAFHSVRDAERAGILHIPQELQVVPDLSVAENVFLGHEPGFVVRWDQMVQRTSEVLRSFGLDLDPRIPIRRLGVGEQQTVLLTRALIQESSFVLFDEPTASLTGVEVDHLFEAMRQLRRDGVGCVFVSHRLDEVLEIADRIAVMRNGELIAILPRSETDSRQLVALMLGRALGELHERERPAFGRVLLEGRGLWAANPTDPSRRVVDAVSLTVRAGEILGLYGLVGAGRSELALSMFGAWPGRSGGDLILDGRRAQIRRPQDAIRQGLCLLTEDRRRRGLFLLLSVAENINIGSLWGVSRWSVISPARAARRADEYRSLLNVQATSLALPVSSLSGGNQQKVLIGRLLAMKPKVLILDEPTRGIDVGAKAEVFHLINQLTAEGLGVLLISSEVDEVLAMADRMVVLYKGRVSGEFDAALATREAVLAAATGGAQGSLSEIRE